MLSFAVVLALSAAPDLPRRLYDQTHDGRWLDAAEAWATERGDLTPEEAAPEWLTRAALAVALQLEHPELAAAMRPNEPVVPHDYLPRWDAVLPSLFEVSSADSLARWELGLQARTSVEAETWNLQCCAVVAGLVGGAAAPQLASSCRGPRENPSAGDRRAEEILSRFQTPPEPELHPFVGVTPLARGPVDWSGPRGKKVDLKTLKLPFGFWAVRAEQAGSRLAVLAAAPRLENRSEDRVLEYWLLLGQRGDWKQYYLGLFAFRPSAAMLDSSVPLLASDDIVRIEFTDEGVEWRGFKNYQIDPKRNYLRTAPLAVVVLDTDHDGLTDTIERRLKLDSTLFDSDWDLVGDADDASPRSHARGVFVQNLVTLALGRTHARATRGMSRAGTRPSVLFVANGTPPRLPGVQLVPVSLDELESVERSNEFLTANVFTALDESGNHGFIEWRTDWSRSGFRVDRQPDGGVSVEEISGWVQ
ncbi:MAG: hypothetical protein QM817_06380 [Archangium sp.]